MNVVKIIQRVKPAIVIIHTRDQESRRIDVASLGRVKWARLARLLAKTPWVRLELTTARGDLLEEIESEESGSVDQGEDVQADAVDQVDRLAVIMGRVQAQAMSTRGAEIDRALTAFERMASVLTDAMITVQESYQLAMKIQATALTANASGPEGGADEIMMKVLQLAALSRGQAPPVRQASVPGNGAPRRPSGTQGTAAPPGPKPPSSS